MDDFNELNFEHQSQQPKPEGAFSSGFSKMTSDMKFVGMFLIIYGIISSLSIIGAIFGIPLLISGLRIREAADELDNYKTTNDSYALKHGFELQGKFFRIHKILILISIILAVLYFIFLAFFFTTIVPGIENF